MDDITLVAYDPKWPAHYEAEIARVSKALPAGLIVAAEHFGSTAIPGLAAKPIIDILIAVRSLSEARAVAVGPLDALGYAFWSDNPKTDRLFFVKGLPPSAPQRTHHLHMTEIGGEMWQRLIFRDYLRAHPDETARYAALKHALAARHSQDREAYTDAKSAYVDAVLANAAAWRFDWHSSVLTRATPITNTYRNTQNVRRFFRAECGEDFKFDRPFMAWMLASVGKTMGEAADEWTCTRGTAR